MSAPTDARTELAELIHPRMLLIAKVLITKLFRILMQWEGGCVLLKSLKDRRVKESNI